MTSRPHPVVRLFVRALSLLHHVLQHLVPSRSTQVAWTSAPTYSGNAFHLYRHMLATRTGLRHCWLVDDLAVADRILQEASAWSPTTRRNTVVVVRRHSPRGYWTFLRSRHVFHTHGVYRWVRSAVRRDCVSLWHGMPIKAIEALDPVASRPTPAFGTMHLATSEPYRHIMARAFRVPVERVLLTRLPRCDVLTSSCQLAPGEDRVRDALGVPDGHRLVLWVPTFRTPGDFRIRPPGMLGFRSFLDDVTPDLWHQVDEHAGRASCHVVLKLHPSDALGHTDFDPGREWGLQHVRFVRGHEWEHLRLDLYDVLAIADGLISDISSVMIDWLLTNRPLGMVGFDPDTYVRDVVIDVSRFVASDRVHDLTDPPALEDFFARLGDGRHAPYDAGLADWLCRADLGSGCEEVLSALGRSIQ